MLRTLGAKLRVTGEALERAAYNMGHAKAPPAFVAFRPAKTDFQTETQEWLFDKSVAEKLVEDSAGDSLVEIPKKFSAATANVATDSNISDGAGVWYHASAVGGVSIGQGSSVLEHAVVEGSSGSPTVIGSGVLVFPHSRIGSGVTVGDRAVIKASAIVESGATIAEDAVVGQGAVVTKGSKVGAGEIWAGNPAAKVGMVTSSAKSAMDEAARSLSATGLYYQTEQNKDIFEIHYERQALKDRKLWAEDFIEDHNNSSQGHLPIYLNMDHFPDPNPERRGLLYNKGEDKGPEGNDKQPYPV